MRKALKIIPAVVLASAVLFMGTGSSLAGDPGGGVGHRSIMADPGGGVGHNIKTSDTTQVK